MNTRKTKVLIVDDHADIRTPFRLGLQILGFEVSEAIDGQSALAGFERDSPDVVVIDQGLPDIFGLDVGRAIRNHEKGEATILILLTGRDGHEVRATAEEIGINGFFLKPISIRELAKWIENAK